MKFNINKWTLALAAAGSVLLGLSADAQLYSQQRSSGSTVAQALFHGRSFQTELIYLDATSDKAASTFKLLSGTASCNPVAVQTNTAATNVVVGYYFTNSIYTNSTLAGGYGAITNGSIVVIQTANDNLTNLTVLNVQGNTNINFTTPIGFALGTNDNIYLMATNMVTPCGNTTLRLYNECLGFSEPFRPLLLLLDGTSAVTINNAIVYRGTR